MTSLTPPGDPIERLRAAAEAVRNMPPIVTRFEVSPDVDQQLHGLAQVHTTNHTTAAARATTPGLAVTSVPWTIDPQLPPRQIRTHYSDGTSKVHEL